jgi:ribonuclease-3 family protein
METQMSDDGHADELAGAVPEPAVIAPVLPQGRPLDQLSPVVLAYVGDAVFEVYVRQHLVAGPFRKPHDLHRAATRYVSAAAQASLLRRWMPVLTEQEADVVRRGRNTKSQPPRNADPGDYRQATALECLVGYLFYKGERKRLEQLISMAFAPEPEAKAAEETADSEGSKS